MLHPENNHPPVEVVDTVEEFQQSVDELLQGEGPIAADVERASGFRYGQKPYLIQLFRRGSGLHLIDPVAITDLSLISEKLPNTEWILHAAHQDLANLFEVGLKPVKIFDTEIAARFIGAEKFGLASLLEEFLGISLEKKYSAVDWSTRPIPQEWLVYAALDVEYLIDLADILKAQLVETDRLALAEDAFQKTLESFKNRQVEEPNPERWRKLSGIHRLRTPLELSIARELWFARDNLAQKEDIAPGRLIPDRSIVHVAAAQPETFMDFINDKKFTGPKSRSQAKYWWKAYTAGKTAKRLPELRLHHDSIPPLRAWEKINPLAHFIITEIRQALFDLAEEEAIPHELLAQPKTLREIVWERQHFGTSEELEHYLLANDFSRGQIELILPTFWQVIVDSQQFEREMLAAHSPETAKE